MMSASTSDLGLLKAVVEFKELFYSSSWARYDYRERHAARAYVNPPAAHEPNARR